MASVYIFRHGETDWNVQRRFQGHTDISLNANGRAQAHELSLVLKKLSPEVVLTSDLSRALETAQIASADLQIPLVATSMLREAQLGEPEGQLRDDIIKKYGLEDWKKWLSVDPQHMDFSFPRGESKRQQLARAAGFVEGYLLANPLVKTLAVSTHGGTLRRLVHNCQGSPQEPIAIPNCSLYHLEFMSGVWKYRGPIGGTSRLEKLFS